MTDQVHTQLRAWLRRQLSEAGERWLQDTLGKLSSDPAPRTLHVALGLAPRRLGKTDLQFGADDLAAAAAARDGWDPRGWSVDVAARVLFVLHAGGSGRAFADLFTDLCQSAEIGEAVALYRGLPLYPSPELLEDQAAEGVRSNMRAVFESVAHASPYPRERFDQDRWNQMVVKALFIGSTLHPMQGLDERANPALARILCDYAHERWAAGRAVTPELWRPVGPFAEGGALADLARVIRTGGTVERQAAALALAASPAPDAAGLLAEAPDLAAEIKTGALHWDTLASAAGQA